jgi:RNA polymerase sigma-70 factor, ECF subfamily
MPLQNTLQHGRVRVSEPPVIAIVDDDASIREALQSLLRPVGWRAAGFALAEDFLQSGQGQTTACLLLDVRLPGMRGLELQRQLGASHAHLPIIFRTSVRSLHIRYHDRRLEQDRVYHGEQIMEFSLTKAETQIGSEGNRENVLARLRAGDTDAFEAWVQEHRDPLFHLLFRLTGDKDEALDLLQETFVHALRGLSTFRGDAAFRTWLYRIAVNLFLTDRRQHRQTVSIDTLDNRMLNLRDDWQRRIPNPEELVSNREVRARLGQAMTQLRPEYRAVLLLRDREGYRTQEVASMLGLSIAAVKSRLHRARLFVRKAFPEQRAV